jgi:D-tyrosyl-tRNA(Tyr) deacylase
MIALLQRVSRASVDVEDNTVGAIQAGLLAFIAVERGDSAACAERLLERMLNYRMFADENGRMNQGLAKTNGGLLLVPQFTLAADTRKGNRPGFNAAAPPSEGERVFAHLLAQAQHQHAPVASGLFGAHMRVSLVNDGPVTFRLRVPPPN